MFKKRYRIVQISENYFDIQRFDWWSWSYSSIIAGFRRDAESATKELDRIILQETSYPKIIEKRVV